MDSTRTVPFPADAPAGPRRIAALVYPGLQILDAVGPLEVFSTTARRLQHDGHLAAPAYEVALIGVTAEPLRASSGLALLPDRTIDQPAEDIDTLIVPGGRGVRQAMTDRRLLDWLIATAPKVRRLAAVCTGGFLLAEAGLLDGRRAATHWASCAALASRYPKITVDPDAIFVRDGQIYSSAGVTAGMDLALGLVEEDFGRATALEAARWLVMFLKRPGGQSQFSSHLAAQIAGDGPIGRVQGWITDNLSADLSVPALAARAAMSPRHFARVFTRQTGWTPAAFVERARVDAARRELAERTGSIAQAAMTCGFGDAERLRRAFHRLLGISPQDYRDRFDSGRAPAPHLVSEKNRHGYAADHRPAAV